MTKTANSPVVSLNYDTEKQAPQRSTPLLQRGDRGPRVKELQCSLGRLQIPVKPDGVYGPETEKAVRYLQSLLASRFDLVVDGRAGKNTQLAIRTRLQELEAKYIHSGDQARDRINLSICNDRNPYQTSPIASEPATRVNDPQATAPTTSNAQSTSQPALDIATVPLRNGTNGEIHAGDVPLSLTEPRNLRNPLQTLEKRGRLVMENGEPKEYHFNFPTEDGGYKRLGPFYKDAHIAVDHPHKGRFFLESGQEYYIITDSEKNVQKYNSQKANEHNQNVFLEVNSEEVFMLPSPSQDIAKAEKQLRERGLILVGVAGTGFIEGGTSTGYRFIRRPDGVNFEEKGNIRGHLDKSGGYLTRQDGSIELLDFRDLSLSQIDRRIEQLKADPTVQAVNIGFETFRPEDLKGADEQERGETRLGLIFVDGEFKSAVSTPAMSKLDLLNVAKSRYPEGEITVLNADGDFYSQLYIADEDITQYSSQHALGYKNANLLVRRASEEELGNTPEPVTRDFDRQEYRRARRLDWFGDLLNPRKVFGKISAKLEAFSFYK